MKRDKILKEILSCSKILLVSLVSVYVIDNTLIVNAQVPTGSMEGTIMTGSRIIINRLAYLSDTPERGDIISFHCPDDTDPPAVPYLKRIIALPGETVEGREGRVYINGALLKEPYITADSYGDFGPFTVPEGSCFVMGDNRNSSWDSRYWANKFVSFDVIIGKAEFEYFPQLKSFY